MSAHPWTPLAEKVAQRKAERETIKPETAKERRIRLEKMTADLIREVVERANARCSKMGIDKR